MINDAQDYDTAAIHQLLLDAFTPEELRRFCHDRADFWMVVRRFSPHHSLEDMADDLVTYCENYLLFPDLLAEIKKANPRQYAHFFGPEPVKDRPAAPTSQIFTISHPISLFLVRVPAGEFQMGSVKAGDKHARDDELPPHPVHVPAFHIGEYPVTNTQYQAFVRATGHRLPKHWEEGRIPEGKYNHPVVYVTWHDAVEFCDWASRFTVQKGVTQCRSLEVEFSLDHPMLKNC